MTDRSCHLDRDECTGEVMPVPGTEPTKYICELHFDRHFGGSDE